MKAPRDFDDDYQPLAWVRGLPIYATTLLVGLHVSALLCTAIASGFGFERYLEELIFSSNAVLSRGAVWQWVTYAFIHPLSSPLSPISFIIEMAFLFMFGREVERFIGWRKYLWLYAVLLVSAPMALTLLGLYVPGFLMGSMNLNFAVFLAFTTLYPRTEIFFGIQSRIIAVALLTLYSLMYLGGREWSQLCALWVNAGAAWFFINWVRGSLPEFQLFRSQPPLEPPARVASPRRSRPTPAPRVDPMAEIDPLLDKIGRHGINSLTAQEREMLERVREKLLKQPKA